MKTVVKRAHVAIGTIGEKERLLLTDKGAAGVALAVTCALIVLLKVLLKDMKVLEYPRKLQRQVNLCST